MTGKRLPSALEEEFAGQIEILVRIGELPEPEREFRFYPLRMWRADFAWPDHKLLVELEGGIFAKFQRRGQAFGWHQSVERMLGDIEKYNMAVLLGFRVLRYSGKEVRSGLALREIKCALAGGIQLPEQKILSAPPAASECCP
jgi:very-short-patch-repair endonuclease